MRRLTKKTTVAFLLAATVMATGGWLTGCENPGAGKDSPAAKAASEGVDRIKAPLRGTRKGPEDALVHIIEFSEFECPFCSRVTGTLDKLVKEYDGKVAVHFVHYPLKMHANAPLAAQAALAAGEQGKFWEMHDKLFANQQKLQRADLERYATELGLDLGKFKGALDSGKFQAQVEADMKFGSELAIRGTPNFLINGRRLSGAQPYNAFKTIVDDELARVQKLVDAGTRRSKVYEALMAHASVPGAKEAAAAAAAVPKERYKVELAQAAVKGGKEPKVTIIGFSDFECPFCARTVPTLQELTKAYGDDLLIAFRHLPLSFHPNAIPAAMAAEAAGEQGKFWEMHDKLFANTKALDRASLERYATELGLDMVKFKAALDGQTHKAQIEADTKAAEALGVRGTPFFFVNGRMVRGAQPVAMFKALIDEELKVADEKLKAGVPRAQLYAELMKTAKDKLPEPPAPKPTPGAPEPGVVYKVDVSAAPAKGPADALVTIVQFSDFECPFCSKVEPTMDRVFEKYGDKVRVVWRDFPLSFHKNAVPAALAARAAGEQGKFWQMHKRLFENQQALDRPSLDKHAKELGLNMQKFARSMDSAAAKKAIDADMAIGSKVGVRGTPAAFINGVFVGGAVPFSVFQQRIDEELKKAEALLAKGIKKQDLYATIMKDAKESVAQPTAAGAPPADTKVYDVPVGNSPTKGPADAPVTLAVFSEFQCPFCSRMKPTLADLEKAYPGKLRIVFKHMPLDFHDKAVIASEAALAAGEQGRFWEMHDKLFENQQALDRPSLDKYAADFGLDMAKFRAAMDSHKFVPRIDQDKKLAATVGVTGTPATFVNGRKLVGAQPAAAFKAVIDEELKKLVDKGAARKTATAQLP